MKPKIFCNFLWSKNEFLTFVRIQNKLILMTSLLEFQYFFFLSSFFLQIFPIIWWKTKIFVYASILPNKNVLLRGFEKLSWPFLKSWNKSKKRMILIVIFTVSIFNTRKNIVILTFYFYVKKIIPSPWKYTPFKHAFID